MKFNYLWFKNRKNGNVSRITFAIDGGRYGIAIQNSKDQFRKKLGRRIAAGRLETGNSFSHVSMQDGSEPTWKDFVKDFISWVDVIRVSSLRHQSLNRNIPTTILNSDVIQKPE